MTMNMSQLLQRVERQFPDAEQISDSVIRFTRRAADQPFAVCYLDVASGLPKTIDDLTHYQDDIIGKRYFEGEKSLQWSNYLYFLRDQDDLAEEDAKQAKKLIENDRTYARKFVVLRDNLEDVLKPQTHAPTGDDRHKSILSIWIDLLVEANLEKAILTDNNLPTRLKKIESGSAGNQKPHKPAQRPRDVEPAKPLSAITLKSYRPYPLRREYDFGAVNLFFGPNAAGKTSLLEAIELFYCGLNKRNPNLRPSYEFDAILADGTKQHATSDRNPQLFRDRNLSWYGQSEIRTNNLYKSFAQFNFLDTDAAASLSESTEHIEDDLSKLLVGPDASKTWRNIERVGDAIKTRLADLRPHQFQMQTELARLQKQLSESDSERQQSHSIRARLSEMSARYNWQIDANADEGAIEAFVGSLAEMVSLAKQAVEVEWVKAPITFFGLAEYIRLTTELVNSSEPDLERLEQLKNEHAQFERASSRTKEALELTTQLRRFLDAGVPNLIEEHRELEATIASYSNQLAAFQPDYLEVLAAHKPDESIIVAEQAAQKIRDTADTTLRATKKEYADFTKLREESTNLAQQLRQIANTLLERAKDQDECPLCHTKFGAGELETHMNKGLDEHLESLGQSLLNRVHEREKALNEAKRVEAALDWLSMFVKRQSSYAEATVSDAAARAEAARNNLAVARARLEKLEPELNQLNSAGLSGRVLTHLVSELNNLGFSVEKVSQQAVQQLESSAQEQMSKLTKQLESSSNEIERLHASLLDRFGQQDGTNQVRLALSRTKERLTTTGYILNRMEELRDQLPWPDEQSISELIVAGETVRELAAKAQSALTHERRARDAQSEGVTRKEQLDEQLKSLSQRIERFSAAQTVLNRIRREHSITEAMESTLKLNRTAIESIFTSIHSPAEFSGLGSSLATLVRESNGREAKLTEISTGQRAAFGLSLFLAQNSQLTVAPPVILIDDPIAHVDDLNSLSFLDYLREIAITGRRQIFFATADDKLATLFERKFDFMGDKFRKFNLSRNT